jgi:site-specific recombinase XerD
VYNPESGKELRHPISGTSLQRAIKKAVRKTNVDEKTSAQTLRHSFATHLVQRGYPIESVQRLLGHKDIRTTKIYEQLANAINQTILSPLDF